MTNSPFESALVDLTSTPFLRAVTAAPPRPEPLPVRTLPFIPPVLCPKSIAERADARIKTRASLMKRRILNLSASLSGYIIDDVLEASGWLIADQPSRFVETRHAALHVLKAIAIHIFIGNIVYLGAASGHLDRTLSKFIYSDLFIIPQ